MVEYDFKLLDGTGVSFSEHSGIEFYDENDNDIITIDPTELTLIYSAYRAMIREMVEEKKWAGK
jgi:hypothetical protein